MRRLADIDIESSAQAAPQGAIGACASLADGRRGFSGVIADVRAGASVAGGLAAAELERRLLEIGFVEGARVEILHEGFIGRDPICVRIDDIRVALRRRDARGVLVRPDPAR